MSCSFKVHLVVAFAVRLIFIAYSVYHDAHSKVTYTDVDYKVFTDASRHVLEGNSPYDRHTYRYSPLIAYLLTLNVSVHHTTGKIIFALVDIAIGVLIKLIVKHNANRNESSSALLWLYNPMSIAISTRGNCDSLAGFLVLLTLYLLECRRWYLAAGCVFGASIHLRLYPIVYSLSIFMHLSTFSFYESVTRRKSGRLSVCDASTDVCDRKTIFRKRYLLYLVPNVPQLKFVLGCLFTFSSLTGIFYRLYGYEFLYETYLFHLTRKDTRHNFSLYFYLQYLTAGLHVSLWQKLLQVLPQLILLVVLSVRFGLNKYTLNFAVLTQTIVLVTYNSVLTSQYFVWIMVVLPLCLWQIRMSVRKAGCLFAIWGAAQVAWLWPAYLLEFQGRNTFLFVWVQGVAFFCANVAILGRLIKCFGAPKQHVE